ncbi:peptidase T [Dermabacter sp. p3-SID358]|uniref:peptidase T n=1 Tax=Dermabacter sp. p3-SID358 TaxID=2916114 RepID=UPI0021A70E2E|nr:peptidase T [Dermabacter sp. p3-SID358]MCT1866572.1 peptidase T [Dermabacter sp. p3-SID358]
MSTSSIQDSLAERFLRYSAISSQSNASATTVPTSEGQWELARLLKSELEDAGAEEIHLSETCVLTAKIPSTLPQGRSAPAIGFCTHLDTVDVNLSPDVRARVIDYHSGDVCLNESEGVWLRENDHPEISRYAGERILVADGTSVLGADDKAGVASVMEAAVRLLEDPTAPRGDVYLSFVPDEEIGLRGVRTMDLARFPVQYAYTLDSCELGEVVESTFNAASATIDIVGVTAHPMNSKGNMVNPILIAHDIIAQFDRHETPEHTEGRESYIWVNEIEGNQSTARVGISIRDHDLDGYEEKKQRIHDIAARVLKRHPRAKVTVEIDDVYGNIEDAKTEENAAATDNIVKAMAELGIDPINLSMRGGTDGSWLSRQGIFTPNFFTGAHNFHSVFEFLPLNAFEKSFEMVNTLIRRAAQS